MSLPGGTKLQVSSESKRTRFTLVGSVAARQVRRIVSATGITAFLILAGCTEPKTRTPQSKPVISEEHARFVADSRPDMYAATNPIRGGALRGVVSNLHDSTIATENEKYTFKLSVREANFRKVEEAARTLCQLRGKDMHSAGVRKSSGQLVPPPITRLTMPTSENGQFSFEFQCGNLS